MEDGGKHRDRMLFESIQVVLNKIRKENAFYFLLIKSLAYRGFLSFINHL